jgi:transposase
MDRYVGIDAHSTSCTLAVVASSGKRLRSLVVETNGRALVDAVRSIPGRVHVCLEEGTQSGWLHEILEPHVEEVIVMMASETKGPKSDARDAWTRAEQLRVGGIQTRVFKAPPHFAFLRNAVRAHLMAVADLTRVKNRLRAVFRSRGVPVDQHVYDAKARAKWVKQLPTAHQPLAEWLGQEHDALVPLRDKAEQWLLEEARTHPIMRKLRTAPGMGPIRAAQLLAIVANPHRFRTRQQFWSYCGLGIMTRSSSDWVQDKSGRWLRAQTPQTRGLSRKRHPLLKAVFKGAATTVTAMPSHPLHEEYQQRLRAGTKPNLAKLTLARRIAAIVLSMWKHQEVYDPKRKNGVADEP